MDVNGNLVVIDASVVMAWLSPDEQLEEVDPLFDEYAKGQVTLAAPTLLKYEVWSGLKNAVKRGRLKKSALNESLEHFNILNISYFDCGGYDKEICDLAISKDLSVYDASYVVLARELKSEFRTLDKKLLNKI